MKKIALQGVEGSYSYEAMLQYFKTPLETGYDFYNTFEEVFEKVADQSSVYGILPIENSSTGSINAVYDLLSDYEVQIVGETTIKITHHLMAHAPIEIEDIETIYSHQQGYEQCQDFFKAHPKVHFIPFKNTALSAQKVSKEAKPNQAAIASALAAKLYGLHIIEENINDQSNNYTRFIVISAAAQIQEDANKISFKSVISHSPGALYKMLSCFESECINLLKIESRPIRNKPWEYAFYIDFEGNAKDPSIIRALDHIRSFSTEFKLLGNYKVGE